MLRNWLRKPERRAEPEPVGAMHVLRHTFGSHLAMKDAPARAIQELADHNDIMTTQRYMHLFPAAIESAIRLLDGQGTARVSGGILEAAESG